MFFKYFALHSTPSYASVFDVPAQVLQALGVQSGEPREEANLNVPRHQSFDGLGFGVLCATWALKPIVHEKQRACSRTNVYEQNSHLRPK